ncbi:MAG: zf-HC2 domain-containing protein [Candidatus Omnitrophica bacterium]|nr:zf-HC2 domain-containing protein [Candidatus Omnitrophota bacterium]
MKCEKFEEIVILYLEKKLKKEEKKKIDDHLKNCDRCREYLIFVKELLIDKKFEKDKFYWEKLRKNIINRIENYIQVWNIRKLKFKKGLIVFLLIFSFVLNYLVKIEKVQHITKYYHFYRDYKIVKNLEELKKLVFCENENECED